MLHKVRYDKQTTNMNKDEQTYWMHYLQADPLVGDYIRSQMRHDPNYRRKVLNQHVCPKCEKFTFFHKNGHQCPTCGTWTPEGKTHKVKIHLAQGHYR